MTIKQVQETIQNGGYICCADGNATLYADGGEYVGMIPAATADRMARADGFTKWEESWGGAYIARNLGKKHTAAENREHCRRIAEDVAEYAAGNVYRCPDCGEVFTAPEDCEKYRCPDCGNVADLDKYEQLSLYDYLTDCYDIEYRCDSNREYRSVQIMIACGGPNIYLDTASKSVELYWWTDRAEWPLSYDSIAALDEWAEEYWNCL